MSEAPKAFVVVLCGRYLEGFTWWGKPKWTASGGDAWVLQREPTYYDSIFSYSYGPIYKLMRDNPCVNLYELKGGSWMVEAWKP